VADLGLDVMGRGREVCQRVGGGKALEVLTVEFKGIFSMFLIYFQYKFGSNESRSKRAKKRGEL